MVGAFGDYTHLLYLMRMHHFSCAQMMG